MSGSKGNCDFLLVEALTDAFLHLLRKVIAVYTVNVRSTQLDLLERRPLSFDERESPLILDLVVFEVDDLQTSPFLL